MQHLAIIMDGNGRWATARNKERLIGHQYGAQAVLQAIDVAIELNISFLTLYAFSTENYNRNIKEINGIFDTIATFLAEDLMPILSQKNIKVRIIGDLSQLPNQLLDAVSLVYNNSNANTGLNLTIAIGYGGEQEILRAVNYILEQRLLNNSLAKVESKELRGFLYTASIPDPDAVVRYGGQKRLSNFMPLQTIYSEIFFLDKLWPDFNKQDIIDVYNQFSSIKRNYGR